MKTEIITVGYKDAGKNEDIDSYNELRTYAEDYNELTLKEILKKQNIKENEFIELASFHCAKGKQLDTTSGSYRTFKYDIKSKWLNMEIEQFNNEKNPLESRNRIIAISQLCGFKGIENCNFFLSRYARIAKLDPKDFSDFVWIFIINTIEEKGMSEDLGLLQRYTELFKSKEMDFKQKKSNNSGNTSILFREASSIKEEKAFQEYLEKNSVEFKNRHNDMKKYIQDYISKYQLSSVYAALQLGDPCNQLEISDELDRTLKQQSKNGIRQYEIYISKESYVQRNRIIEIGLLMLMNLDELNGFLKAVNMDELYPKSKEGTLIYYLSRELKDDGMLSKKALSDRLSEDYISIFDEIDDEFSQEDYHEVIVCHPRYFYINNKTIICFFDEKGYKYKIEVTEQNADLLMFTLEGDTIKINKANREKSKVLQVVCIL